MKKIRLRFFAPAIAAAFLVAAGIVSCATTDKTDPAAKNQDAPKKQKESPKAEESEDIRFARMLQEFLDKGDVKGAIACFDRIPEKLADDTEMRLLLGALYFSDTQYDNAEKEAKFVLEKDSANMDALELVSMCVRAKGDKSAYKAVTDQILKADPHNPAVNIQKAEDFALSKRYKQAQGAYRDALRGDPKNTDALFGYAQMSYYLNDIKTAQRNLNKILEIDPQNSQAYAYLAKIEYEDENYYRASALIKQAIDINPMVYDYWMDYGTYLRYQGKYKEAAECWQKASELDPTYFLAYAYLAGNYDEQEQFDLALKNYHKVIETNPKYFYAYESTAILEYHAGNYKGAIQYFTKAYSYRQDYSYSLMIAASYMKLKDSVNAKKILANQLKNMDRNSLEYDMVRFYHDAYTRNAETTLKQKIEKEQNSNKRGKMLFYLGLYYELMGADDMAKEFYAKVTNMNAPMFFEYRIAEWGMKNESNS